MGSRHPGGRHHRVERPPDIEAFLARAGDFLGAREAENNLLFGICSNLRANPTMSAEPARFAVVIDPTDDADAAGRVVAAALQTPPFNLVLSHVDDLAAVDALAGAVVDWVLPGVLGPAAAALRFAERWTARTGRSFERRMAERVFRVSTVRRPVPTPGWIAGRGRTLYLWQDGHATVSLCGVSGATPTGIRVGPVYTPPEHRGRGYASNVVAEASQAQLDTGRRFVFLFTDLSNPTSNAIYGAIGYEPVVDVDSFAFHD